MKSEDDFNPVVGVEVNIFLLVKLNKEVSLEQGYASLLDREPTLSLVKRLRDKSPDSGPNSKILSKNICHVHHTALKTSLNILPQ